MLLVTLRASAPNAIEGTAVTLTAQANQSVGPSPFYVVILASAGTVVAACAYGTTCSAAANSIAPASQTYTAFISTSTSTSTGTSPQASSSPVTVTWSPLPSTYHTLTPTRLLDSRYGTGLTGAFSSNVARTFHVAGVGGAPGNAAAVTGNLTVTSQTGAGYLYIGPVATNDPTSSTLNFPLGDDRANGVTVALGAGGILGVTYVGPSSSATADVIFDVTGYFVP